MASGKSYLSRPRSNEWQSNEKVKISLIRTFGQVENTPQLLF